QERLSTIKEVTEQAKTFVGEEVAIENEEAAAVLEQETFPLVIRTFRDKLAVLEEITPQTVQALLKSIMKELKLKGQFVYMPIRVALTGQQHGPDLFLIIEILGKDLALRRIERMLA
ncbi:MAG TPA: glutamate--tRNA ligase, partial [Clostridia bacterium]|nr:glutamate--tRNA ligase [Clostridia bacterium]